MPRIYIAYDENAQIQALPDTISGLYQATLDLPDGLDHRDIYEVARKLAELLLEQVQ